MVNEKRKDYQERGRIIIKKKRRKRKKKKKKKRKREKEKEEKERGNEEMRVRGEERDGE